MENEKIINEIIERTKIEQMLKQQNLKCIGDIPTYILVENNIDKKFWTRGQLIDYISFLENNYE